MVTPVAIIKYNGASVPINGYSLDDLIFRRIKESASFYELDLLQEIRKANRRGVYIDGGANIGNHSIFFSLFCPAVTVYAVEAARPIFEVLQVNLRAMTGMPIHAALADKSGEWRGVGPIDPANAGKTVCTGRGTDVETLAIDDMTASTIAVTKLDLEGGELDALRGAVKTIEKDKPLIAAECHTTADFDAIDDFLSAWGYVARGPFCATPTWIWE